MSALESAIPEHLARERTCPMAMKEEWQPPYPSYSARFEPSRNDLTMLILGVQAPAESASAGGTTAGRPAVGPASAGSASGNGATRDAFHKHSTAFLEAIDGAEAVAFRDQSEFVDATGALNRMVICYLDGWADGSADRIRRRWLDGSESRPDWGFFVEEIRPSLDRVETLYSSAHVQGVGHLADSLSGEIREHGYWGSARDRMPGAQRDRLDPKPGVTDVVAGGIVVHEVENLCLIRSGQDWSETSGEERAMYLDEVEPTLRAGMDYLTTEGTEIGCIANRYARALDDSGRMIDQSFGLSWWRSMAELDAWAKDHSTHKAIFGVAMRYLGEHGGSGHLKLTHEVFVVEGARGRFEYRNCHPGTGLLAAGRVPSSATAGVSGSGADG
jgi:aldoxime dehydratase